MPILLSGIWIMLKTGVLSMFEWGLSFGLYFINSIAGSIYADKFLKAKTSRKTALIAWAFLYFVFKSLIGKLVGGIYPFGNILKVAVDMVIVLFLQMVLYQKNLSKQFFVAVSFIGGKEIIIYIIIVLSIGLNYVRWKISYIFLEKEVINSIDKAKSWTAVSNGILGTMIILLYALMIIVYFTVLATKFVKKDYYLQKHENAFLILPSIAALCIAITLRMMILPAENEVTSMMFDRVPATLFWVPLICILLLGVNVSSVILFQKMVQLNEEERKHSILENQMVQMQREIKEIQDIYADMRGLKHDMKSHLESIAAVVGRTDGKERQELDSYIGKMEETVGRLDFYYQTGNPIIDVILHQKKQEAEKQNINFISDFIYPDKNQIDVYDIGIVLNNALENAVEAARKTAGNKKIIVRSYQKGSLFFIEVENDFEDILIIDTETGLPVSSKEDRRLHGFGMENIQRCARKYKGDIDITVKETEKGKNFILTVMMYEKTFTPKMP